MPDFKLSVTIAAVDKITAPINKISKSIAKITKPIRIAQNSFRRFGRAAQFPELLSRSRALGDSIGNLGSQASAMARKSALAFASVGSALFLTIKRVTALGDTTAKTADRLGTSVRIVERWQFAAERSGVKTGELVTSLQKLQRQFVAAQKDTKSAAAGIFRALDVDVGTLEDLPDILDAFADGLAKVKNPTKRNAVLMEIMGRSGVQMATLLSKGSKGIRDLGDEAERVGAVLGDKFARQSEKTQDSITNLTSSIRGISGRLIGDYLPAINRAIDRTVAWVSANKDLINSRIKSFISGLVRPFEILGSAVENVSKVITDKLNVSFNRFETLGNIIAGAIGIKLVASFGGISVAIFNVLKAFVLFDVQLLKSIGLMTVGFVQGALKLAGVLITSMMPAISSVTTAISVFSATLLANPIAKVILLVASLATAVFLLVKNWDSVADFFKGMWSTIEMRFNSAVTHIARAVANISNAVIAWVDRMRRISFFNLGTALVANFLDGIQFAWRKVTGFIATAISDLFKSDATQKINVVRSVSERVIGTSGTSAPKLLRTFSTARAPNVARVTDTTKSSVNERTTPVRGNITVDFLNAPRGTRVIEQSADSGTLDITTGLTFALP